MTDKERWKIQNKLYRMKDTKIELELLLERTEKNNKIISTNNFLAKGKGEPFLHYLIDLLKIFLLDLDKIFLFYYTRYSSLKLIKELKKDIKTITQEIQYYEYKL